MADVGVLLLPALVVVLFNLLHLRLRTTTAGGISILVAVLVVLFVFPRRRIRFSRLMVGIIIAVGVALLMSAML